MSNTWQKLPRGHLRGRERRAMGDPPAFLIAGNVAGLKAMATLYKIHNPNPAIAPHLPSRSILPHCSFAPTGDLLQRGASAAPSRALPSTSIGTVHLPHQGTVASAALQQRQVGFYSIGASGCGVQVGCNAGNCHGFCVVENPSPCCSRGFSKALCCSHCSLSSCDSLCSIRLALSPAAALPGNLNAVLPRRDSCCSVVRAASRGFSIFPEGGIDFACSEGKCLDCQGISARIGKRGSELTDIVWSPFDRGRRAKGIVVMGSKGSSGMAPGDDLPDDYEKDDPSKKARPRRAGIILHPTSLPGPHGIGDFGSDAFKFLDWLESTGCRVWQVLPLVPPGRKAGEDGSPYAGQDANCGNTLLISLNELVKDGLLEEEDLPETIPVENVNYEAVAELKDPLILKAAKNLVQNGGSLKKELEKFRKSPQISCWLEEAALFAAIDADLDDEAWWQWPEPLRDRNPAALEKARKQHKEFIDVFIAQQFLFQKQWQALHAYAHEKGIKIIGDMPIYVGGHSADVWANRGQFMMDEKTFEPVLVSGVPPDLFSATGQLWGSPLYNWRTMAKDGYKWWASRMRRAFELYDEFRIDHFRGLAGYWAVPAEAETAMEGRWKMGPRVEFFNAIRKAVGKVDIIAEDLGIITTDVVELRKAIAAPGMVVLHFAFGSNSQNPHLPHNHEVDQVVYSGTHDNDTTVGWWSKASEEDKDKAKSYLRIEDEDNISWELIRAAMSSVARTAIVPMQDVLSLDSSARMNTPAVKSGNWAWRIGESAIFDDLDEQVEKMKTLLATYNRLPRSEE